MTLLTHQVPSAANMDSAKAVCAIAWANGGGPQNQVSKTADFNCLMAKLVGTNGFKDPKNAPATGSSRSRDPRLSQGRPAAPAEPSSSEVSAPRFATCRGRGGRAGGPPSDAAVPPPPDRQPKQRKRSRRRKRPCKPRSKPDADSPPGACVARPPTQPDLTVRVGSPPPEAEIAGKGSPRPSANSAIAFILGGNDDISDSDGDWDAVDAGDDGGAAACPLDVLVMPLLNGLFSVSVRQRATRTPDELDGMTASPQVRDANDRWNREYGHDARPSHRISKVNFGTGDSLLEVHDADDMDRRGPWEQMAIDRKRFQARIASAEAVLKPILSAEHRRRIYENVVSVD